MVNTNDYEIDEELELKIKRIATQIIKEKGFDFITFDDSIATIRFERSLLEDEDAFGVEVKRIIDVAIEINRKVYEMLEGDF